jgi:hypothetical protein
MTGLTVAIQISMEFPQQLLAVLEKSPHVHPRKVIFLCANGNDEDTRALSLSDSPQLGEYVTPYWH